MRRMSLAVALLASTGGCTIDTELGVAAEVETAQLVVEGTGDAVTISLQLAMRFRVGEHAEGERTFVVPRADVFVGERPAVAINLERPASFDGTLAPGESESVSIMGSATGALSDARTLLCAEGAEAEILVRWEDRTVMEIGMADFRTGAIDCR